MGDHTQPRVHDQEPAGSELDRLRSELRALVESTAAQLRAEIAAEIRTRRLVVVDRYGREWITTTIYEDCAELTVTHPEHDLNFAATMTVNAQEITPFSMVYCVAGGNVGAEIEARAPQ